MPFKTKKMVRALLAIGAAGTVCAVNAQTAPQKVEKIEVTGSNIKRVDAEGPAPVQIITRQDIERSGATTVGEVMRNLPANSANSFDDNFTGSFARGSAGVSLRGLGQKSTLTLINGRRMVNFAFAQNLQDTFIDLNSIPLAAIERIEILKDGASAIYGSDAIAGVVNIIMRKDFTGYELTTGYGKTQRNDGAEKRASAAVGWGEPGRDKLNLVGVLDYFDRDTIWASNRDFSSTQDQRRFQGGTDLRSTLSNPGNYARRPGTSPFGPTRIPFANCPAERQVAIGGVVQCVENTNIYNTLLPETERLGGFTRATYDFSSTLTGFAEVALNKTKTFTQTTPFAAPSTQVGPGIANAVSITLPVGHPNNPYNVPVDVRYRFDDVGPRQVYNNTLAKRYVAGIKGALAGWEWETAILYGNSYSTQDDKNGIRVSGLLAVIADGSYNFLNPSANTQATYDRLRANYQRRGDSTLKQWDGKASTELMQLANGPLALAIGAETRKEELHDNSDNVLASGDVLGRGSNRANASRTESSAYAEFNIPALKNLEIQLAGRVDHYSDFGSSTTPKVAFRWTPDRDILIRGSYSKGFRAPTLVENGDSSAYAFNTVIDSRRCAINAIYCASTSVGAIIAGGTNLQPEKSTSKSLGFVWDITKETSLTTDFYDISQKNIISTEGVQTILAGEASNPVYAARVIRGAADSNDIARGAPGAVVAVLNQFTNLTELRTKGIDIDLRWRLLKNEYGTFTINSTNTYLASFKTQLVKDGPMTEFAGKYDSPGSFPRYRAVSTITWEQGPWLAAATYNHVGAYASSVSAPPGSPENIGNWDTIDLQGSFSGFKNFKVTLGVRNLADRAPPIDLSSGSIPYDITQHNPRGTFYYGTLNYKFK